MVLFQQPRNDPGKGKQTCNTTQDKGYDHDQVALVQGIEYINVLAHDQ